MKPNYPRRCAICGSTQKLRYVYEIGGVLVQELRCEKHYLKERLK